MENDWKLATDGKYWPAGYLQSDWQPDWDKNNQVDPDDQIGLPYIYQY